MNQLARRGLVSARRCAIASLAAISATLLAPSISAQSRPTTAFEQAKVWVEGALQISSVEKRREAIESIRGALGAPDTLSRHAALIALQGIRDVDYDKKPFRALVLPYLSSADGAMRCAAACALYYTAPEPADLALVLAFARDPSPEVQESITYLIHMFSKGDLTGEAGPVVLDLLRDPAPVRDYDAMEKLHRVQRGHLHGIAGARLSGALEARIVELSRSSVQEVAYDAAYFVLSTQMNKSRASVARLVELLATPLSDIGERALWGLGHGIEPEAKPAAADAMLAIFEPRADSNSRSLALRGLKANADASHVAAIEALAAKPALDEPTRAELRALAASLKAK